MAQEKTNLIVPRREASKKIDVQIKRGVAIRNITIDSRELLGKTRNRYQNWYDYNVTLLESIFSTSEISDKYTGKGRGAIVAVSQKIPTLSDSVKDFKKRVQEQINKLRSIKKQLELYNEPEEKIVAKKVGTKKSSSNKIFIVHGRDARTKGAVDRFLKRLKLKPVILHTKPNMGRTIIEKFEAYADVEYAIILLTPDDVGGEKSEGVKPELKKRARQNVVFEHGFFIGKLGRERVCALRGEDVELPSDMSGILYITIDEQKIWKISLAKELRAAGYEIGYRKLEKD